MSETKTQILNQAHALFNKFGVRETTLRQIAREVGISHSNLTYHFKSKTQILEALHERLLEAALKANKQFVEQPNALLALVETNYRGFQVLNEYRFFMLEFHYIMRTCPELQKTIQHVKLLRVGMYQDAFERAYKQRQMKAESYPDEWAYLIERIGIFSDFWISSADIYDDPDDRDTIIKYMRLFISMIYPCLTNKARAIMKPALKDKKWWRRFD